MPPEQSVDIAFTLNGQSVRTQALAGQHTADLLRSTFKLTGTHLGCEHGVCGACNILVDGRVIRGCLHLALQANGATVSTIEHLYDTGAVHEIAAEFVQRNALQCGYCTPGMLLTAWELLESDQPLDRTAIRIALSGNICRCTGYQSIVDAVEAVARRRGRMADG
jgi:aerobic-type carbon monoxide dehydrogenase small subunit (CoxS/CutS family)